MCIEYDGYIGIAMDVVMYNTILKMACDQSRHPLIESILDEMRQQGISFQSIYCMTTILGIAMDSITYGTLIDMYCKHNDLVKLEELLNKMESEGINWYQNYF